MSFRDMGRQESFSGARGMTMALGQDRQYTVRASDMNIDDVHEYKEHYQQSVLTLQIKKSPLCDLQTRKLRPKWNEVDTAPKKLIEHFRTHCKQIIQYKNSPH